MSGAAMGQLRQRFSASRLVMRRPMVCLQRLTERRGDLMETHSGYRLLRISLFALALVALLWFGLAHEVFSAQVYYDIYVTTTQDKFDPTVTGADCSLREAIQTVSSNANNGGCEPLFRDGPGPDRIFLPSGTY